MDSDETLVVKVNYLYSNPNGIKIHWKISKIRNGMISVVCIEIPQTVMGDSFFLSFIFIFMVGTGYFEAAVNTFTLLQNISFYCYLIPNAF